MSRALFPDSVCSGSQLRFFTLFVAFESREGKAGAEARILGIVKLRNVHANCPDRNP
jgi:hypothetical protein